MEVDCSLKSRMTFNRKAINNNEIAEIETEEAQDCESGQDTELEDDLEINFWQVTTQNDQS